MDIIREGEKSNSDYFEWNIVALIETYRGAGLFGADTRGGVFNDRLVRSGAGVPGPARGPDVPV